MASDSVGHVLLCPGITEGRIKHLPSNQDLLKSVTLRVRSLSYGNLQSADVHFGSDGNLSTVLEAKTPLTARSDAAAAAADTALAAALAAADEVQAARQPGGEHVHAAAASSALGLQQPADGLLSHRTQQHVTGSDFLAGLVDGLAAGSNTAASYTPQQHQSLELSSEIVTAAEVIAVAAADTAAEEEQ